MSNKQKNPMFSKIFYINVVNLCLYVYTIENSVLL